MQVLLGHCFLRVGWPSDMEETEIQNILSGSYGTLSGVLCGRYFVG